MTAAIVRTIRAARARRSRRGSERTRTSWRPEGCFVWQPAEPTEPRRSARELRVDLRRVVALVQLLLRRSRESVDDQPALDGRALG